jgi:hypothetical protein
MPAMNAITKGALEASATEAYQSMTTQVFPGPLFPENDRSVAFPAPELFKFAANSGRLQATPPGRWVYENRVLSGLLPASRRSLR